MTFIIFCTIFGEIISGKRILKSNNFVNYTECQNVDPLNQPQPIVLIWQLWPAHLQLIYISLFPQGEGGWDWDNNKRLKRINA